MCDDKQLKASFARMSRLEDEHATMKSPVTDICDLDHELPPDAPNAPQWLVDALQVPREEGWVTSDGDIHYFRGVILQIRPYFLPHGFLPMHAVWPSLHLF